MDILNNDIWVEEFRPKKLDEIIGHDNVKTILKACLAKGFIPNLMFYGQPSTGKTSTALALASEFYGDDVSLNFMELNASDERGIDVVRGKIKDFAKQKPMNGFSYNVCFLDEADSLTSDAQAALRRTMEKFSNNCRFILSCNYQNKIIDPIQSRGLPVYFGKMSEEDLIGFIDTICEKKGLIIDENAKRTLIKNTNRDMRKIINSLQACSMVSTDIDSQLLSSLMKIPSEEIIRQMLKFAINGSYDKADEILISEFVNNGFDGITILNNIYEIFKEFRGIVDNTMFIKINQLISETEIALHEGNSPYIQLGGLLSSMALLGRITPTCTVRGCR